MAKVAESTDGRVRSSGRPVCHISGRNVPMALAEIRARGCCYALCAIADRAKKIIEIAQTDVRDPAQISALAIKEIGIE
jgi:hypothetical protein